MSKEKTKVYLYTRVSTAMQIDGYSLDAQKSRMKAFCEFNDYEISGEYEDAGKSGKFIEGRTSFNNMMEDIKSGKDDVSFVLVFKLSRFGRNAADVLNSLQTMQDFGVNLICVEDGIDSSKEADRLMISVLSAVAEIERENIRVQTMEGRMQKAREGKWNGGFAPYGYSLVDGKLEINEEEAVAIRTIFDQYVNTDMGANGIAKYLENHGIHKLTRQNGKNLLFDAALIRRIIQNPVYCGKIAYGRRRTEKVHGTRNDYRQVYKDDYLLVDGQQRLTTIMLLLLAIRNLVTSGKVSSNEGRLDEQINQRFLISPWAKEEDKIKLRPVKKDRAALEKLFGEEEDFDPASNLTLNYRFFCSQILKEEISVDDLYAAISRLEIISITLDATDNAQLIFESLNSTGLALQEGDKIRNYILMGQPPKEQNKLYDTYWAIIEKCTGNGVSSFVRDCLSIKQQVTPTISNVYKAFKEYAETVRLPMEALLEDLRRYARFYEKLLICKSGLKNQQLDDCLYRMMRLEIVVTRPFLMEVLRLNQDGKLSVDEVLSIFLITENYLFRRNICEVPTNALNKIFLNLNKEILRYDNTPDNYVQKLIYALLSKKESGRFPTDEEFTEELSNKQVYQMRGKYKAYLFERLENYGTIETKDVYTHLDNNIYTIEHIMPQHLTPAWNESLGVNASEIHETWLHRLANLTLTGYNPNLSNKTFAEKRDAETGGYKASGLKLNQKIANKESWGLPELEERNEEMLTLAKKIWEFPKSDFVPAEKEFDICTLDDENVELTGRDIAKYSYQNAEQPVSSWADMFEHIVKYLHQKDTGVLSELAYSEDSNVDLSNYVSSTEDNLRSPLKIDENLYVERNTSTALKMSVLRRLFALYGADPMDLVFYLKDQESEKAAEAGRFELRQKYWSYALPIIL